MPAILKKEESQSSIVEESVSSTTMTNVVSSKDEDPPLVQVKTLVDKKIRNLEKRKSKLEQYKLDLNDGKTLRADQLKAVECIGEVEQQIEISKEIQRGVNQIVQDASKIDKNIKHKEFRERCEVEVSRIRQLLVVQDVLDALGKKHVRQNFIDGVNGAVKISDEEFSALNEAYANICPTREDTIDEQTWSSNLENSARFICSLLNYSTKIIPDKKLTFKELRFLIDKISSCGYFTHPSVNRSNSPLECGKSSSLSSVDGDAAYRHSSANHISPAKHSSPNHHQTRPPFVQTSSFIVPNIYSQPSPTHVPYYAVSQQQEGDTNCLTYVQADGVEKSAQCAGGFDAAIVQQSNAVYNNSTLFNGNPTAYCPSAQEAWAYYYPQQTPYIPVPSGAFVDPYDQQQCYPTLTTLDPNGCSMSQIVIPPPPFMSSKTLDPNAPSFVSRTTAVNWIPVMWPRIQTSTNSSAEAVTYGELQEIEDIGSTPPTEAGLLTDGSITTVSNGTVDEVDEISQTEADLGMLTADFNDLSMNGATVDLYKVPEEFGIHVPTTIYDSEFEQLPCHPGVPVWIDYNTLHMYGSTSV